ncbi:glutathione S-transferase [Fusarium solani]|uniref:glutathione transferase n=1 Tax=Fusarium solani TaxID=169388 RepID=A0A9P9H1Y8_FUSSL|nr:glutathione S-transferase [Fusarium solani]KAH7248392.1 glutathione S-transferase [Fusarium solani]
MAQITLFTDSRFPCPQRLQLVILELGITVKGVQELDIERSEQKSTELRKLNPSGAVPFIQDDAQKPPLLLSESRAIARYLALRYSTSTGRNPMLVPDAGDFIGLAKFEEAASIELTCFDAAANPLVFEEYFKLRYSNQAADTERCKALRERLNDVLTLLDNRLAGQQFMAGETVTLVDFFYVPYMHYLATHVWPSVLDGRQHLGAWWKMMQGRDSYRVVFGQQAAN